LARALENFDDQEVGLSTVKMSDVMDVEKCIMMSADLMAMAQQGQMGGPPGEGAMGQAPPPGAMGMPVQ